MKKFVLVISLLLVALSAWWGITASNSEYRTIENTDFIYSTIIINSPNPERLSDFYQNVFKAQKMESDSEWILEGTSPAISLKTPGYQERGPLLTILKSGPSNKITPSANDLGYAHICFESDDIPGLIRQIQRNGGKIISTFLDLEKVPAVYAADPDGNIFEVHIPFPTPVTPNTIYRTLNSFIRTNFKLPPPETDRIRFLHININSPDWIKTVDFYTKVLGTSTTGFERDYKGEFIETLTGVKGAEVKGRHIALPGYTDGGPTFEIFTYNKFSSNKPRDRSETGRIATGFRVLNLETAARKVTQEGGILISQNENRSALFKDIDGNLFMLMQKK